MCEDFSTKYIQYKYKYMCKQSQFCHHRKFRYEQVQRLYRTCHDQIPIMPKMFQPPQICCIGRNHGWKEKHGIKQRMLCPQTVPSVLEDFQILQIIESSISGRDHRQEKKSSPRSGTREVSGFLLQCIVLTSSTPPVSALFRHAT